MKQRIFSSSIANDTNILSFCVTVAPFHDTKLKNWKHSFMKYHHSISLCLLKKSNVYFILKHVPVLFWTSFVLTMNLKQLDWKTYKETHCVPRSAENYWLKYLLFKNDMTLYVHVLGLLFYFTFFIKQIVLTTF